MNMLRDTLSVWLRNPRKKKVLMIVGGGVLLLLVILCITIVMHLNIQGRYANAAE